MVKIYLGVSQDRVRFVLFLQELHVLVGQLDLEGPYDGLVSIPRLQREPGSNRSSP